MFRRIHVVLVACLLALALPTLIQSAGGSGWTLVGWSDLGMHRVDADYAVFSILPLYSTIRAQLVDPSGALVTSPAGITVTYEAVADAAGSINTTSAGKTNFWDHVAALYGASPAIDVGLADHAMPGASNTPQPMPFEPANGWFIAEGVPITPHDDAAGLNPYPMMRLVARDGAGAVLATTDIVLPVSDEIACRTCHASGSPTAARPRAGWVNDPDPERDVRLNVLLLHDESSRSHLQYQEALAGAGYDAAGLLATATNGTPVLCAACHASNALPGSGQPGVPAFTRSIHGLHAAALDPATGRPLDALASRDTCYNCHAGAVTRHLRGVMGNATIADASHAIECQSCHGTMGDLEAATRRGRLDEPACQQCHTGTAVVNNGALRYTSVFEPGGAPRVAVDATFATTPDTPEAGLSLYRLSKGHGGLACAACHGSPHAEAPASLASDNVQHIAIQGHAGPLAECDACHAIVPSTANGGPHGLHPLGQPWVDRHGEVAVAQRAAGCKECHGTDLRGTVLSRARGERALTTRYGTKTLWSGFQIGCWACHHGPESTVANRNRPPVVSDAAVSTPEAAPRTFPLTATDADKQVLGLRVVSQPAHGRAGIAGSAATYVSDVGFQGEDTFTFAAWDGQVDSNLGTVTVSVGPNTCELACSATAPSSGTELIPIPFRATVDATGCVATPGLRWDFGNGVGSGTEVDRIYETSGIYAWTFEATADGQVCRSAGTLEIAGAPPLVTAVKRLGDTFRIVITGVNFHTDMLVFVGETPWTSLDREGTSEIMLRGGTYLRAQFPPNTGVPIRLVNPDDGEETTILYNRTTRQWEVAASTGRHNWRRTGPSDG